jgi:hypothetical protein
MVDDAQHRACAELSVGVLGLNKNSKYVSSRHVLVQRDDTSVLRNYRYEATTYCGGADSAIDASPGEDGILGSRERSQLVHKDTIP